MEKRGFKKAQANIIGAVLLIILVLAAVIILWNVVRGLITESTDEIGLQTLTTKLTVQEANLYITGGAKVKVKREPGKGNITSLKFVFYNEEGETTIIERTDNLPDEAETKVYDFDSSQINTNFVKVGVVPMLGKKPGMEFAAKKLDKSAVDETSGLVSWWKFDGNAYDEMGKNNGVKQGDSHYVDNALVLDGDGDYIVVSSPSGLPTGNKITITAWINPKPTQGQPNYNGIVVYGVRACTTAIMLSLQNDAYPAMATWCNDFIPNSGPTVDWNQWNFIAVVLNGQSVRLYVNEDSVDGTLTNLPNIQSGFLNIGSVNNPNWCFNGSIDNPMIFDKVLTPEQITSIYNKQNKSL